MLCAIPIRTLRPRRIFLLDNGGGDILVGRVERVAQGYVSVSYASIKPAKRRRFTDKEGEEHEFEESGFRRSEWSPNTLVRPYERFAFKEGEEDPMSDTTLVEDAGVPAGEIKEKVSKLKKKAKVLSGPGSKLSKGKPSKGATKAAKKEPLAADNPCRCGCGTKVRRTFAPGHDARFYGWMQRVIDGRMKFAELPKVVQRDVGDVKGAKKLLAAHKKG